MSSSAASKRAHAEIQPPSKEYDALVVEHASWPLVQNRLKWAKFCLIMLDILVLWLCFFAGLALYWIHHHSFSVNGVLHWWQVEGSIRTQIFATVSTGAIVWLGAVRGHYTPSRRSPWWDEVRTLLLVLLICAMADTMLLYLGKWPFSRLWIGSTWIMITVALPLARLFWQQWLVRHNLLVQPYVIVGSPQASRDAVSALASEPLMGYQPVAMVLPPGTEDTATTSGSETSIPCFACSDEVLNHLRRPAPYLVVIALDNQNDVWLRSLAQELMLTRSDVIVAPALAGLPLLGMEVSHFFSHEVLLLRARNNLNRRAPQLLKRVFDVISASLLLILALPLMAWVAWQIRREDGGPVFFVQPRVGRHGKPFSFLKFRSMVVDADAALASWKKSHPELYERYRAGNFKLADDPRVTRVGRWIRRSSVDELPQLINVLRGDMSLVGPRPLLSRELSDYGPSISTYHMARPGITGLWQITGRSNTSFSQRIDMDLWYVRNWSLWYDFVILMRTVGVVLRQEGAV